MNGLKKVVTVTSVALTAMLVLSSATAFAADSSTVTTAETSGYHYLIGQQRSRSRNELYAQAASIEDETERKAFLTEHGIGDTEYSEDAIASYSYVSGRQRGASYRSSTDGEQEETPTEYRFLTGRQRGASYSQQ